MVAATGFKTGATGLTDFVAITGLLAAGFSGADCFGAVADKGFRVTTGFEPDESGFDKIESGFAVLALALFGGSAFFGANLALNDETVATET